MYLDVFETLFLHVFRVPSERHTIQLLHRALILPQDSIDRGDTQCLYTWEGFLVVSNHLLNFRKSQVILFANHRHNGLFLIICELAWSSTGLSLSGCPTRMKLRKIILVYNLHCIRKLLSRNAKFLPNTCSSF